MDNNLENAILNRIMDNDTNDNNEGNKDNEAENKYGNKDTFDIYIYKKGETVDIFNYKLNTSRDVSLYRDRHGNNTLTIYDALIDLDLLNNVFNGNFGRGTMDGITFSIVGDTLFRNPIDGKDYIGNLNIEEACLDSSEVSFHCGDTSTSDLIISFEDTDSKGNENFSLKV